MKFNKIGLIVASSLLLAGCQSQNGQSTDATTSETPEVTLEVTVSIVDSEYVVVSDNQTQHEYSISMDVFNQEPYAAMLDTLNPNDILSITYSGETTESMPEEFVGITNIAFVEDVEEPAMKTQTFSATVTSVDDDFIILNADQNSTIVSGEVWVAIDSLDVDNSSPLEEIKADTKVNVEFSGMVTMSLPPQLRGVVVITVAE